MQYKFSSLFPHRVVRVPTGYGLFSVSRTFSAAFGRAVVFAMLCFARMAITSLAAPMPGCITRTWQTDDGLPANNVTAVVQTRDGCVWLGTRSGVARFVGVRSCSNQQRQSQPSSPLPVSSSGEIHPFHGTIGFGGSRFVK